MNGYSFIEGYVRQDGLVGEMVAIYHSATGAFLLAAQLGEDVWPGQRVYISSKDGRAYGVQSTLVAGDS